MTEGPYVATRRSGAQCKQRFTLPHPLMARLPITRPGANIRGSMSRFMPSNRWGWEEVISWCTDRNIRVDYVLGEIYDESVAIEDPKYFKHQLYKTWFVVRFVSESDAMLFKLSWVDE